MSARSLDNLIGEIVNLKKQMYTFQLKGVELHNKAKLHITSCKGVSATTNSREEGEEGNGGDEDENRKSNGGAISSRAMGEVDLREAAFGHSDTVNPLSNDYIFEMIAYNLPHRDLQTCKKVCRFWKREIIRLEMKKKSIVIGPDNDGNEVNTLIKQKQEGNLVSVGHLVVVSASLASDSIIKIPKQFGTTLSRLSLDDCTFTPQEVYNLLSGLPCLDSLVVKTSAISLGRNGHRTTNPFDNISSDTFSPPLVLAYLREFVMEDERPLLGLQRLPPLFPNLENLRIKRLGLCVPSRFDGIQWTSLKKLDIKLGGLYGSQNVVENQLEALAKMGLKLKSLILRSVSKQDQVIPAGTMDALKKLLNTTKDTVELVRIFSSSKSRDFLFSPFPLKMPRLHTLEIDMSLVTSLKFINWLPSLTRFICKSPADHWVYWWKILNETKLPKPHKTLKDLSLGAIDGDCLEKLGKIFPNVSRLELVDEKIDDKAFRVICSVFPNLTSLRMTSRRPSSTHPRMSISDSGLIGVPTGMLAMLKEKDYKNENGLDEIEHLRVHPNVTNLKKLVLLELSRAPELTDLSMKYGLASLSSLNEAALPVCKITDDCLSKFSQFYIFPDANGEGTKRIHRSFKCSAFQHENVAQSLGLDNLLQCLNKAVAGMSQYMRTDDD